MPKHLNRPGFPTKRWDSRGQGQGGRQKSAVGVHIPVLILEQCHSEEHWNNSPQTPNLASYDIDILGGEIEIFIFFPPL